MVAECTFSAGVGGWEIGVGDYNALQCVEMNGAARLSVLVVSESFWDVD